MRSESRYLFVTFTVILAALASTVTFNYVVDPYDINGTFYLSKVNEFKPEAFKHARLHKSFEITKRRPLAAVFGSSRAAVGFSMDSGLLGVDPTLCYNASIPASNIFELSKLFAHAVYVGGLKKAVINIDFFQFNGHYPTKPDFDQKLLYDGHDPMFAARSILQKLRVYISKDTLLSSFATLAEQRRPFDNYLFEGDGSEHPKPLEQSIVRNGGQRALFRLSEEGYVRGGYLPGDKAFSYYDDKGVSTMSYLVDILKLAKEKSVDLRLVISPTHARDLELLDALGLWNDVEKWKRDLVILVEQSAPGINVQLWDFSKYSVPSVEKLPALNDQTSRMKWYWESSHFTKKLGAEILKVILANGENSDRSNFGTRLNHLNIESNLEQIRLHRDIYRIDNRNDAAEIQAIAREYHVVR